MSVNRLLWGLTLIGVVSMVAGFGDTGFGGAASGVGVFMMATERDLVIAFKFLSCSMRCTCRALRSRYLRLASKHNNPAGQACGILDHRLEAYATGMDCYQDMGDSGWRIW